jgi:hypothetical protein
MDIRKRQIQEIRDEENLAKKRVILNLQQSVKNYEEKVLPKAPRDFASINKFDLEIDKFNAILERHNEALINIITEYAKEEFEPIERKALRDYLDKITSTFALIRDYNVLISYYKDPKISSDTRSELKTKFNQLLPLVEGNLGRLMLVMENYLQRKIDITNENNDNYLKEVGPYISRIYKTLGLYKAIYESINNGYYDLLTESSLNVYMREYINELKEDERQVLQVAIEEYLGPAELSKAKKRIQEPRGGPNLFERIPYNIGVNRKEEKLLEFAEDLEEGNINIDKTILNEKEAKKKVEDEDEDKELVKPTYPDIPTLQEMVKIRSLLPKISQQLTKKKISDPIKYENFNKELKELGYILNFYNINNPNKQIENINNNGILANRYEELSKLYQNYLLGVADEYKKYEEQLNKYEGEKYNYDKEKRKKEKEKKKDEGEDENEEGTIKIKFIKKQLRNILDNNKINIETEPEEFRNQIELFLYDYFDDAETYSELTTSTLTFLNKVNDITVANRSEIKNMYDEIDKLLRMNGGAMKKENKKEKDLGKLKLHHALNSSEFKDTFNFSRFGGLGLREVPIDNYEYNMFRLA